jgi:iturin family lipopeptide synthetase A
LDQLPLTANGKIDKKKLPDPVFSIRAVYVPPGNEVEKKLASIWQEVLNRREEIGIRDNFFELGGHSINATRIRSSVLKEFGIMISMQKMFEEPTIEKMANEILNSPKPNQEAEKMGERKLEKIKI